MTRRIVRRKPRHIIPTIRIGDRVSQCRPTHWTPADRLQDRLAGEADLPSHASIDLATLGRARAFAIEERHLPAVDDVLGPWVETAAPLVRHLLPGLTTAVRG
jgi:hypothetical protein